MDHPQPTTPLSALMKSLCDKSTKIRRDMCSLLSLPVTDFNKIKSVEVCKKGNNKITKPFLCENIIQLTNITDSINDLLNPVFECETLSKALNNICNNNCDITNNQLESDIDSQLATGSVIVDAVDKAMKQHTADIEQKLSELYTVVRQISDSGPPHTVPPPPKSAQNANRAPNIEAPEPAVFDSRENFLTADEEDKLIGFLSNVNFSAEKGHSVKNFGANYKYTGAGDVSDDDNKIPAEFDTILEKLRLLYPDININQCLVNRYESNNSTLSQHSDNEPSIDPESSIYTVSLGQDRTVIFKERFGDNTIPFVAKSRSLYAMTRSSQAFYTHQIDAEPDSTLRYSITFRNVEPKYRKSTIIIGDSNSKFLAFGEGIGTFGKAQPGKRVKAARVSDINPYDCAGYSNVVLMVGTNNLWPKYIASRSDVEQVFEMVRDKIDVIRYIRKDIKIVLLPVLPTRLSGMNRQIYWFNSRLFEHFISSGLYFNVSMPSIDEFFDSDYLLKKTYLRNSQNDAVHLNSKGLAEIAGIIKMQIFSRYNRRKDGRPYSTATRAVGDRGGAT